MTARPIPDETVDRIGELFEELCVEFPWQKGDLIAVDNMLVSHARRPFSGERKLLVAMGHMVKDSELAAAVPEGPALLADSAASGLARDAA